MVADAMEQKYYKKCQEAKVYTEKEKLQKTIAVPNNITITFKV